MASYYSNGKVLISGEYAVLKGAMALVLPLKYGQSMDVVIDQSIPGEIDWKSYEMDSVWFEAKIKFPQWEVIETSNTKVSKKLIKILKKAADINSAVVMPWAGFRVTTKLNYPQKWGLGSSSTLISNIASWFNIDPFILNAIVSKGSGFDIAAARSSMAVVYQLMDKGPFIKPIDFKPSFMNKLFLIYTGNKQSTDKSLKDFLKKDFNPEIIPIISSITRDIILCQNVDEFDSLIQKHDEYIAALIDEVPVKKKLFLDYPFSVKYLGAWGGDFLLATGRTKRKVEEYFNAHGYNEVYALGDMLI